MKKRKMKSSYFLILLLAIILLLLIFFFGAFLIEEPVSFSPSPTPSPISSPSPAPSPSPDAIINMYCLDSDDGLYEMTAGCISFYENEQCSGDALRKIADDCVGWGDGTEIKEGLCWFGHEVTSQCGDRGNLNGKRSCQSVCVNECMKIKMFPTLEDCKKYTISECKANIKIDCYGEEMYADRCECNYIT